MESPIQSHQSKQEGEDEIHTQLGPWPGAWSMWKQPQTRPEALGLEDLHTGLPPRAWVPEGKSLEWEGTPNLGLQMEVPWEGRPSFWQ